MKRTKRKQKEEPQTEQIPAYQPNDEPIVLSKITIDLLMAQKNFPELLALYTFYYYTAKWQKTNQPKASIRYVCSALHWDHHKVIKYKKQLKELGLIEDVRVVDPSTGKTTRWYVLVHFIWTTEKIKSSQSGQYNHSGHMITTVGDFHTVGSFHQNALNTNNKMLKGLINNTPSKKTNKDSKNKIYLPLAIQLSKIIQEKKNIQHTSRQINNWANDFRRLKEENHVSIQRMKYSLNWYADHIGGKYIPVIESGSSFREKFGKLEAAKEREENNFQIHDPKYTNTAPEKEYDEGEQIKIF